jgi:hypothetical protein
MQEGVALEYDVLDAIALEVPAHREAGVSAADDDDRDPFHQLCAWLR